MVERHSDPVITALKRKSAAEHRKQPMELNGAFEAEMIRHKGSLGAYTSTTEILIFKEGCLGCHICRFIGQRDG
jgi:hypothetical protein